MALIVAVYEKVGGLLYLCHVSKARFFSYIVFITSFCYKFHAYSFSPCHTQRGLPEFLSNFCYFIEIFEALQPKGIWSCGACVCCQILSFYVFMFLIDELLPVFLYFCGALLLSFILLMEVRNLFRYSFVDSQAFEWRK